MMEDLSLHILDIAENAVTAGATRVRIAVNESLERDILTFRVTDNGRGMSRKDRSRVFDPFFSTERKRTGLGLPLLAQTAEVCGGRVVIESASKKGTKVIARFRWGHVDRPPMTKIAETLMILFFGHPEVDFRYRHTRNGSVFSYFRRGGSGGAVVPSEIAEIRNALAAGLKGIGAS